METCIVVSQGDGGLGT